MFVIIKILIVYIIYNNIILNEFSVVFGQKLDFSNKDILLKFNRKQRRSCSGSRLARTSFLLLGLIFSPISISDYRLTFSLTEKF